MPMSAVCLHYYQNIIFVITSLAFSLNLRLLARSAIYFAVAAESATAQRWPTTEQIG